MEKGEVLVLKKLGNNVRNRRLDIGISQEELAHQSCLDRTYVGGIERGERNVTVLSALKLCSPLSCSLSSLLEGVGHE